MDEVKEIMEQAREMGLEERFLALAEILDEMESDEVTLERSFALYQEGLAHVKAASASLDSIEKAILVLNAEGGLEEF
jgi:exodeoxyribonuclease VII small subunit